MRELRVKKYSRFNTGPLLVFQEPLFLDYPQSIAMPLLRHRGIGGGVEFVHQRGLCIHGSLTFIISRDLQVSSV